MKNVKNSLDMEEGMKKKTTITTLACSLALGAVGAQAEEVLQYTPLGAATEVRAELVTQKKLADSNTGSTKATPQDDDDSKPPEGKCGEGKCGDNKPKKGKPPEGKCGEGKCGDNKPNNG